MECIVFDQKDYGGFWRRYFADCIDIGLLSIAFTFVEAKVLAGGLLSLLIFLAYMIGFKKAYGATPGYMILGMRIVSIDNAEITVIQIIVRLISSIFSALVFGLGFISIAFDKNKQGWHDKIAGTYVIRTGAYPLDTTGISRPSLINFRAFILMLSVSCLVIIGFFSGTIYFIKSSGAYRVSEQYIRANPWVQQEVGGQMKFGLFPSGYVAVSGTSGEANFAIQVSGDKGEVTVYTTLEKKEGTWVIIEVSCEDKRGKVINIKSSSSASWEERCNKFALLFQQGRYAEA